MATRRRKNTETQETTDMTTAVDYDYNEISEQENPLVEQSDQSDTETTPRKQRTRVTVDDLGDFGEIAVTSEAPRITRSRNRNNPFDGPVLESYNEAYWDTSEDVPEGTWLNIHVGNMDAAARMIRASATFHGIGSEVRFLPDTDGAANNTAGTVYFRGCPKRERKAKAKTA